MVTFMTTPRALRYFPDPILIAPCKEINFDTWFDTMWDPSIVSDLTALCVKHHGYAIAAPQVGETLRYFVLRPNPDFPKSAPTLVMNPTITNLKGDIRFRESCLSIPGFFASLNRPDSFTLNYVGADGKPASYQCRGLLARVVQHELDHLDGMLFTDRLVGKSRDDAIALLKRMAGEAA